MNRYVGRRSECNRCDKRGWLCDWRHCVIRANIRISGEMGQRKLVTKWLANERRASKECHLHVANVTMEPTYSNLYLYTECTLYNPCSTSVLDSAVGSCRLVQRRPLMRVIAQNAAQRRQMRFKSSPRTTLDLNLGLRVCRADDTEGSDARASHGRVNQVRSMRWTFALAKVVIHNARHLLDLFCLCRYRDTPL